MLKRFMQDSGAVTVTVTLSRGMVLAKMTGQGEVLYQVEAPNTVCRDTMVSFCNSVQLLIKE